MEVGSGTLKCLFCFFKEGPEGFICFFSAFISMSETCEPSRSVVGPGDHEINSIQQVKKNFRDLHIFDPCLRIPSKLSCEEIHLPKESFILLFYSTFLLLYNVIICV